MSRAEEAANRLGYFGDGPIPRGGYDENELRLACVEGYQQAEQDLIPAACALVDAVERYTMGRCLRSELLNKKDELKKLIGQ